MVSKREGRLDGGKTSSAAAQIKPQPSPAVLSVTIKIICGNDVYPKKPSLRPQTQAQINQFHAVLQHPALFQTTHPNP
ncbi:hypothetical protein HMPREF9418_0658 [Neisseria macacae ATCC 33926]|uniref:Uncharacterized protein n=1 Tax=Neisseria macacae ATCC 33926 TaxID=997348 RepID=A0AA36UL42_9NEIS|nr:hypothetical protein HMPREF9418_0658 [Neisseria macacae ATCC 33926]